MQGYMDAQGEGVNQSLNAAERRYHALLRTLPCIVCRRIGNALDRRVDIHHISKGTSPQNNWLVIPLCREHHDPLRTGSGLHGMSEQRFCAMFKVPHLCEYGMLAWVNQDLCEKLTLRKVA
jgi:hypothetical protein